MNLKKFAIFIGIAFSLQGCGTFKSMEISAVLSPQQQEGYMETITSQKKHFVSLAPYEEQLFSHSSQRFIPFILFVKNQGGAPIAISDANLSIRFVEDSKKSVLKKIDILSYQYLNRELLHEEMETKEMVDDMRNYHERSASSPELSAEGGRLIVSSLNQLRDAEKRYAQVQSNRKLVEKMVMKPETIIPGHSHGGLVVCDGSAINPEMEGIFHIGVAIEDEVYTFTFNRNST